MARGREKAFAQQALRSRPAAPPSRATTPSQSRVTRDSRVIPCWNHTPFPDARAMLAPVGSQPGGVLVQHHPRQRPPLALPPVCALAWRFGRKPRPLQMQLRPGVAPAEAVVLDQMLVEMLDREALVALAIEPLHLLGPIGRDPFARRLAKPPVDEARLALLLVSPRPAPERPLAHPEQFGRLLLAQLRRFPAAEKIQKHRHAHPLKGFRPAHPTPPKRAGSTGQIVRYLNRTYRVLPTRVCSFVVASRNRE